MRDFYFTFGSGHHHAGGLLTGHYTIICAKDVFEARQTMHERRGNKFCSSYRTAEEAGVTKWGLTFIAWDEVTKQNGETY